MRRGVSRNGPGGCQGWSEWLLAEDDQQPRHVRAGIPAVKIHVGADARTAGEDRFDHRAEITLIDDAVAIRVSRQILCRRGCRERYACQRDEGEAATAAKPAVARAVVSRHSAHPRSAHPHSVCAWLANAKQDDSYALWTGPLQGLSLGWARRSSRISPMRHEKIARRGSHRLHWRVPCGQIGPRRERA